ncbi:MAG TPA: hypothetical protein PLX14_12570 [Anaerolineales bacterium]|nr:hypothetical protein [Anaerolineales bacterium]HNE02998.1 hypothetical protein [Anaerolineales bacterium]
MQLHDHPELEAQKRQALAKVYALLIRLTDDREKQTAHPDNFDETTGKAENITPTCVKVNVDKLYTHTQGGYKGVYKK